MKRLWIALAILLLMWAGIQSHALHLKSVTAGLIAQLEEAQTAAEQGNWSYAAQLTRLTADQFREQAHYLHITLKHQDVNEIQTAFQEVLQFLHHQKQADEYAAANARLTVLLDLLAQSELCSLNNIL